MARLTDETVLEITGPGGRKVTTTLGRMKQLNQRLKREKAKMAKQKAEGAGTALAGPEETSIPVEDRIVDGSTLIHRAMRCKEVAQAYVKLATDLHKKLTTETRKACGYRLSGRQQMLFASPEKATFAEEAAEVASLQDAMDAAVAIRDPEEEDD